METNRSDSHIFCCFSLLVLILENNNWVLDYVTQDNINNIVIYCCHVTVVTSYQTLSFHLMSTARLLWLTSWLCDQAWDGCQEHKQFSSPSVLPTAQRGGAQGKRETGHHPLSSKGTSGPFSRSHLGPLAASGFTFSASAPQCCPWGALTTRCPAEAPCDSRMEGTRFATFFLTSFSEVCDLSALWLSGVPAWDVRREVKKSTPDSSSSRSQMVQLTRLMIQVKPVRQDRWIISIWM